MKTKIADREPKSQLWKPRGFTKRASGTRKIQIQTGQVKQSKETRLTKELATLEDLHNSMKKACEERDQWQNAQIVENVIENVVQEVVQIGRKRWEKPLVHWMKCNVGFDWSKKKRLVGAAWVLRDQSGNVFLHSRRCFANMDSRDDAKILVLIWAIECMVFHRVSKVIFAIEFQELVGAVNRPKTWPSVINQRN